MHPLHPKIVSLLIERHISPEAWCFIDFCRAICRRPMLGTGDDEKEESTGIVKFRVESEVFVLTYLENWFVCLPMLIRKKLRCVFPLLTTISNPHQGIQGRIIHEQFSKDTIRLPQTWSDDITHPLFSRNGYAYVAYYRGPRCTDLWCVRSGNSRV